MRRTSLPVVLPVLVLYLSFLTRTYYWDGVLFALNIESVSRDEAPLAALIHPNHLLYSGLGYVAYDAASRFGIQLRAITILQIINAIASTALAYLLYRAVQRYSGSNLTALAACMLFAFGATWWKFSTDADAYIASVLLLSIAVALAMDGKGFLAGFSHAVAMLMHQLAIFGCVPILIALFVYRRKIRLFPVYLVAAIAPVLAAYLIAYRSADHHTYPTLLAWVASSSTESKTTHSFTQLLGTNAVSYLKLFAGGRLNLVRQFLSIPMYVSLASCVCFLVYGVWLWFKAQPNGSAPAGDSRLKLVLWSWLTPYILFLSWFEPGNAFYKLFIWPPIVVLLSLAMRTRRKAALSLALAVASWNFGAFIFPHSQSRADPVLEFAEKVNRELPKSATIYYREFVPDDWYLRYFAPGRQWIPLPPKETAAPGPVCFETTALDVVGVPGVSKLRWALVDKGHNVELQCLPERR